MSSSKRPTRKPPRPTATGQSQTLPAVRAYTQAVHDELRRTPLGTPAATQTPQLRGSKTAWLMLREAERDAKDATMQRALCAIRELLEEALKR